MYIKNELKTCIENVRAVFPGAYITLKFELILDPKENVWFNLEDVETELDFKCKLLSSLSRNASKNVSDRVRKYSLERLNLFLNTNFDQEQMMKIYSKLGNHVNKEMCESFVKSNYNMALLEV